MITINGKKYPQKPFDIEFICDYLEASGLSIAKIPDKPMSAARAYFQYCSGLDKDEAGKELTKHIVAGGKLDDIYDALDEEVGNFIGASKEEAEEAPEKTEE